MNLNIGDRVKVKNLPDNYKSKTGMFFVDGMKEFCGKFVTICAKIPYPYYTFILKIKEDSTYNWVAEFFEPTTPNWKEIIK